ncbi:MAG: hypothetical protein ACUVUG_02255 [Candidatus Aminicenantia bacterium]
MQRKSLIFFILFLLSFSLSIADKIVLRNGQLYYGELAGYSNGIFYFDVQDGYGTRTLKIPKTDVVRIEFVEERYYQPQSQLSEEERYIKEIKRGKRQKTVTVFAHLPWLDTLIDVKEGDILFFEVKGNIRVGPGTSLKKVGPEGEAKKVWNDNKPIPGESTGALIGKIGDTGAFYIGDQRREFRMPASGRLYLGINDDFFGDNSGFFTVIIYY